MATGPGSQSNSHELPLRDDHSREKPPSSSGPELVRSELASDSRLTLSDAVNPYAPSQCGDSSLRIAPSVKLSFGFWGLLAALGLGCLVLAVAIPGVGIVLLLTFVPAAVRVPLVLRRVEARNLETRIPEAKKLLISSWGLMIAFIIASSVAFIGTCISIGMVVIEVFQTGDWVVNSPILLGFSGLIASAVFLGLFILSLRIHR